MKVEILKTSADKLEKELLTDTQMDVMKEVFFENIRTVLFADDISDKDFKKEYAKSVKCLVKNIVLDTQEAIIDKFILNNFVDKVKSTKKKKPIKKTKKVVKKVIKKKK